MELRNYSQEVVSLVDLINNISSQTQMLSLNAAIEAARVGEHGRGFSIVAMEVGKLASETENVSKKLKKLYIPYRKKYTLSPNPWQMKCPIWTAITAYYQKLIRILSL